MGSRIVDRMVDRQMISEEDKELYLYGIQLLVERLVGVISIFAICVIFGRVIEGTAFYISYSVLRKYAGGFHAEKFIHCYLSSCIVTLCCITLSAMPFARYLCLFMMMLSVPAVILLSPVEYESRPLDKKEVHRYRRIALTVTVFEVYVFAAMYYFGMYSLCFSVAFALSLTAALMVIQKISISRKNHITP